MLRFKLLFLLALSAITIIVACTKNNTEETLPTGVYKIRYNDSIFYQRNSGSDYIISPMNAQPGTYEAFPEGLEIDEKSGAINISESETGLRYKILYTSQKGDSSSTVILLSGINYVDEYFNMAQNDSVIYPVYNADINRSVPNGVFDVDGEARKEGCAIDPMTGSISLKQTMRNGFFGGSPNGVRKEVTVSYRLNDKSNQALQSIDVLLYYYNTMNDVPQDLQQKVDEHLAQIYRYNSTEVMTQALAKPRPPCVVIIGH